MSLRAAAAKVCRLYCQGWIEARTVEASGAIEALEAAVFEPDDMAEAKRLLNGVASLIEHEMPDEWSDHAVEIREFLKRIERRT